MSLERVSIDCAKSLVKGYLDKKTRELIVFGRTSYPRLVFDDSFVGGKVRTTAKIVEEVIEDKEASKYSDLLKDKKAILVYDVYTKKVLCVKRKMSGMLARLIYCYITRVPVDYTADKKYFNSVYFSNGFSSYYFERGGKLFKVSGNYSITNPLALNLREPTSSCVYRIASLDEIQVYLHQLLLLLFNDDSEAFERYLSDDKYVINHKAITKDKEDNNWVRACENGKLVPKFGADAEPEKIEVITTSVNTYLGFLISKYNISEIVFSGTDVDVNFIKFALENNFAERMGVSESYLLEYLIREDNIPFELKKQSIRTALGL